MLLSHALSLLLAAQVPIGSANERLDLIQIDVRDLGPNPAELISRLDLDVANHHAPASGVFDVVATAEDEARLRAANVPYQLVVTDLVEHYRSRLAPLPESPGQYGRWLSPPFAGGGMGGYYTWTQVVSVLDQMRAAYPHLITAKQSIGQGVEGRDLWMVKISDNPDVDEPEPEMRIDAMHHAREPQAMQSTLWFMLSLLEDYGSDPLATYLVNEREMYFIPVVNPDGYVYNQNTNPGGGGMWRKNRRNNGGGVWGVDLNRNYPEKWGWDNTGSSGSPSSDTYRGPSPVSEPEIAATTAFTAAHQFKTSISVHTYQNLWMHPYGWAAQEPPNSAEYYEIANLATVINGYGVGPAGSILYLANGVTHDFDHERHGVHAWIIEIGSVGDGFWPPTARIVPLAEENRVGMQCTALAAGAWSRVKSVARTEVGDGDGYFEPGEGIEWRLTVRNTGTGTSATPIVARLVTSDPHVTVTKAQHAFGALAPFSEATNQANPLTLTISPSAPPGASVAYTLELVYEGWTQTLSDSFSIGAPRPFLRDDAQVALGWKLGVPGDNATSGLWVRAAPIGTIYQNQLVNPDTDATPAPGTNCYVTGNGGGAAGNDDVDNGVTTLVSPAFDLSAVGPARLSYARWFAIPSAPDDVFSAYLSNDDGQNWTLLETLTHDNHWVRSEFQVTDVLPQTARMRLRFVASDLGQGSLVEAGIDDLEVQIFDANPRLNIYGDERPGGTLLFHVTGDPGSPFAVAVYTIDPGTVPGQFPIGKTFGGKTLAGTVAPDGLGTVSATIPAQPWLSGKTFYFKGVVGHMGARAPTNLAVLVVQ